MGWLLSSFTSQKILVFSGIILNTYTPTYPTRSLSNPEGE